MSRRRLVSTSQAIYSTFHNANSGTAEDYASDVLRPVNKRASHRVDEDEKIQRDADADAGGDGGHSSPAVDRTHGDAADDDDTTSVQQPGKKKKRQKKVTASDVLGSKRNFDKEIARRSLAIFINAMLGVALMITVLQVCWDGEEYHPTETGNILKWIITGSTVILIYQIIERRKFQMEIKMREKSRNYKISGPDHHGVSHAEVLSLSSDEFRWKTWAQLLVCAFHPLPSIQLVGYEYFPDEVGLLMFFRLYTVFRVIRDYSAIWTHRRLIRKSVDASNAPNFDWWLSLKTMAFRAPLIFYVTWVVLFVSLFGYCIYIVERVEQPDIFSFGTASFLAAQCILTGWASDTYDVYDPLTWAGRITCILSTVIGLFIVSFLIGVVSHEFVPSGFEYNALNWLLHKRILDKEKNAAASLIQLAFRNYRRDNTLWDELEEKDPDLYERVSEQEEKVFMQRFLRKSKVVKSYRRQRMELEDEMDPTSKQNMSVVDLHFDQKLDRLMNDFKLMQTHNDSSMRRMEGLLALHLSKTKPQSRDTTLSGAAPTSGTTGNNSGGLAPYTPLSMATLAGVGGAGYQSSPLSSPHSASYGSTQPPLVHSSTWTSLSQQTGATGAYEQQQQQRDRSISGHQHPQHAQALLLLPPPPPHPSSVGQVYTPGGTRDRHHSSPALAQTGSGSSGGTPPTALFTGRQPSPTISPSASSSGISLSRIATPVGAPAGSSYNINELKKSNVVQPGGSING